MSSIRFPEKARAVPGRPIIPAWKELEKFADQIEPERHGKNVRAIHLPGETIFSARRPRGRPLFFFGAAIAQGKFAVVRPGYVNHIQPTILDGISGSRMYLDGRDLEGVETGRQHYFDIVSGDHGGPGENGRSFLCLRILVLRESGIPAKEELGPAFLEVTHRSELPAGFFAGGMPEEDEVPEGEDFSSGLWPIAELIWKESADLVLRWNQFVLHNQTHRFTPAEVGRDAAEQGGEDRRSRHWFFGAS